MVIKMMRMDADMAERQVSSIQSCVEMLTESLKTVESLREGQTPAIWTGDGKAVELTALLQERYRSSALWLDKISKQLEDAYVNIQKAIDETDQLDADQKARYQNLLYTVAGSVSPMKPIAV